MIQSDIRLNNGHRFTKTYNYDETEKGIQAGYDQCCKEYPDACIALI